MYTFHLINHCVNVIHTWPILIYILPAHDKKLSNGIEFDVVVFFLSCIVFLRSDLFSILLLFDLLIYLMFFLFRFFFSLCFYSPFCLVRCLLFHFVSFALIHVYEYVYGVLFSLSRSHPSPILFSMLLSNERRMGKKRVEKRLPGLIDCDTCNATAWLFCCRDIQLAITTAIVDITASDAQK